MCLIFYSFVILLAFMVYNSLAVVISATSPAGIFRGITENVTYGNTTSEITKFLGIPFAEPPIGDRRFARPVKKAAFKEPFSAFKYEPSCPQDAPVEQSEDCLYLNVFTPDINGGATRYAVMIFIYGGGFIRGDGDTYGSEKLSAYGQVVVVTFNYRLGPFGFLDVGDKSLVQPNNGLMDQHLAIKWVRDNIASFGGDISRITLFGQSAGSASVIFQSLYPPNEGLFQRAIAQSGSASDFWATTTGKTAARNLAKRLNCTVESTKKMLSCLKAFNETKEMTVKAIAVIETAFVSWSPSYDNLFVVRSRINELRHPTGTISLPVFDNIDFMMGTCGYEGQSLLNLMPFYSQYENEATSIETINSLNKQVISIYMKFVYETKLVDTVMDDVVYQYSNFEDPRVKDKHIIQVVNFITDFMFTVQTHQTITRHFINNNNRSTYHYQFDELYPYRFEGSWIKGAVHGGELGYIFAFPPGLTMFFGPYGDYNQTMARSLWPFSAMIITYWTNFAKNGNPNGNNLVEWKEFNTRDQEYLYLKSNQIEMRHHLHARRVEFWNSRLPTLIERIQNRPSTEPVPTQCTSSSGRFAYFISLIMYSIIFSCCSNYLHVGLY